MKKIINILFLYYLLFISLPAYSKEKIIIHDFSKSCDKILEANVVDYRLCKNWMLDKNAIIGILQKREKADILNPVRDMSPFDMRIFYIGSAVIDNVYYNFSIYSTSWFSLYNFKKDEITYYMCQKNNCGKYFLGSYISEGVLSKVKDEDLDSIEDKLTKKINNNKRDIIITLKKLELSSKWKRAYHIKNGYELIVDHTKCKIVNILNNNSFNCYALEYEKSLYIYNDLKTNKGYVNFVYNNHTRFNDGDFILKLIH